MAREHFPDGACHRRCHGHLWRRWPITFFVAMWLVARFRPLVACWLALLAIVTAVGLLLVGPFDDGRVVRWDLDIATWFVERRTDALDALAEAGTWLSETITVPVILLVAIVIAWRVSTNVAAPVFLALAVGGEKLLYLIASLIVGRDRPPVPTVGTHRPSARCRASRGGTGTPASPRLRGSRLRSTCRGAHPSDRSPHPSRKSRTP